MKLVGFKVDGKERLGLVEGGEVVDLTAADANLTPDMSKLLTRSGGDLSFLRDVAKKSKERQPLKASCLYASGHQTR